MPVSLHLGIIEVFSNVKREAVLTEGLVYRRRKSGLVFQTSNGIYRQWDSFFGFVIR